LPYRPTGFRINFEVIIGTFNKNRNGRSGENFRILQEIAEGASLHDAGESLRQKDRADRRFLESGGLNSRGTSHRRGKPGGSPVKLSGERQRTLAKHDFAMRPFLIAAFRKY
jgi:hypothetical protein